MSDENKKDEPKVQADNDGIAIGSLNIDGSVDGTIIFGNNNTVTNGYAAEQVAVLIAQIQSTFQPKPFDGRCPYKGLDVFKEEDAELFFGREKLVDDLVSRVKDSRTVFVTGPSGSGKSSLVRAGLIHALKQGDIKGSERWLYATMKPGRDPLESLATSFSRLKSPDLGNYFRQHVDQVKVLHECAESALTDNKDQRLILFIDQFEEVFTQISKEEERVAFLNLLTHAATIENGRVIILFSMRSDFVSNCATYPQLNAILNQQFVQIGAMQPEELVSAIAQPALRVGLRIDPDLIAQIINEMKGEPGALPLMQFALKDLFDSQQGKDGVPALILNDYLQRGGIHKALERHADDSFSKLSKNEQELARSIFSGLIEIGRGTQDTKRTAMFDELVPANAKAEDIEVIVQKLADARLITTDETAGKDTVTISHEKLIDAWPWLKKLVNENRDVIALQNEIASDAKEWDEHKRDASYLYTGGRLANVREQLEKQKFALNYLAQEFVRTAKARQRRMQAFLISAVSAVLIAAIVASVVFQNQAQANVEIANTAQAASTLAFDNAATAQAEKAHAEEQTKIALSRQIASQAQFLNIKANSNQMVSALLDIQSIKLFPTWEAADFLINTNKAALPITRMIHDGWVDAAVAFSPDGKYVVSGSDDNTARVWDALTGKEIARMTHGYGVNAVAFSPDGKYVVSGGCDKLGNNSCSQGTARVWEAFTGKEIVRMTHDNDVRDLAFSPDGKYVISGSYDKTARVWEALTGKEIARMTYDDYEGSVYAVAFSPDGKYVVSGSGDNTARVWDAESGKEVARMTHDDDVWDVAFSPDGKYVASGSGWNGDGTARVWEAASGKEIARMTHDGNVTFVAFSPDGRYVVSAGSWDNTARVWEVFTGKEVARMTHDGNVSSVAFSPDGKYMVSGGCDKIDNGACLQGSVRVWEAISGREAAHIMHSDVKSVAFSPDGKYVVSGGCDKLDNSKCSQGSAQVWEAESGKDIAHMTHDGLVRDVTFSRDGKYVVSGSDDKTARVWDALTGEELARMTHDDGVTAVAFSSDGKYVVSGSNDKTARVWKIGTGEEVARMTHDNGVAYVAFSPDGKYVVSRDGETARVWDATSGKEIAHMTHDQLTSVAFSPDGKYVVSGGCDTKEVSCSQSSTRVWETLSGQEVVRMTNGWVSSMAFSPDGKYVVLGSNSGSNYEAQIWEVGSGKAVARVKHDQPVYSVAFSPDGKYVVSGSGDNTARVWEAASGKEVAHMTHDGEVSSVAFSPEGKYVVSGSADGTVRVWAWQPNDVIANACKVMPRNLTRVEWTQYIGDALPYQAVCKNLPIEAEVTATPTAQP